MRIALFGYGKMGKMIEQVAVERGHEIVVRIDEDSQNVDLENVDVAIDFSMPKAAFGNIKKCLNTNVPVISGTTGWLENYEDAVSLCREKKGAFIYASNFSLGVNIFFELNSYLAKMMQKLPEYKISLEEIHHTQKLDAPSGTAITLAEGIIANSEYERWELDSDSKQTLPITSKRIGNTPGTHVASYNCAVDAIEIKHTAYNREGFALGAVTAAEWIVGKTGIFSMRNVLNLG